MCRPPFLACGARHQRPGIRLWGCQTREKKGTGYPHSSAAGLTLLDSAPLQGLRRTTSRHARRGWYEVRWWRCCLTTSVQDALVRTQRRKEMSMLGDPVVLSTPLVVLRGSARAYQTSCATAAESSSFTFVVRRLLLWGSTATFFFALVCVALAKLCEKRVHSQFTLGEEEEARDLAALDFAVHGDWAKVEPTLRPGDIILMRGSGIGSRLIVAAQLAYAIGSAACRMVSHPTLKCLRPWSTSQSALHQDDGLASEEWRCDSAPSLRWQDYWMAPLLYSHVAMVVKMEPIATSPNAPTPPRAIILEAMVNTDTRVPDVQGVVREKCVQCVYAHDRLHSVQQPSQVPAYTHFAVRRLRRPHTSDDAEEAASLQRTRKEGQLPAVGLDERIWAFAVSQVGRPLDVSPAYWMAYLSPHWHNWLRPWRSTSGTVSCSELLVGLYDQVGLLAVSPPPTAADRHGGGDAACGAAVDVDYAALRTSPFHFTAVALHPASVGKSVTTTSGTSNPGEEASDNRPTTRRTTTCAALNGTSHGRGGGIVAVEDEVNDPPGREEKFWASPLRFRAGYGLGPEIRMCPQHNGGEP